MAVACSNNLVLVSYTFILHLFVVKVGDSVGLTVITTRHPCHNVLCRQFSSACDLFVHCLYHSQALHCSVHICCQARALAHELWLGAAETYSLLFSCRDTAFVWSHPGVFPWFTLSLCDLTPQSVRAVITCQLLLCFYSVSFLLS